MLHITEQPGWDRAIIDSDETKLAQWYQDAKDRNEGFLISDATWDWCLAELRDKAEIWQTTGRLLVFDNSSVVCQANLSMTVSPEEFQKEISRLGSQQSHDYPLVDPSLFPLVYDHSHVLVEGGYVSLDNLWGLAGQVAKSMPVHPYAQLGRRPGWDLFRHPGDGGPESCWSNRFQWLPCEVHFTSQALNNTADVQITSYVNNLHPDHHRELYKHLERLIADAIPSWDEILFYGNTRGRRPPRILTYGCEIYNKQQEDHKVFKTIYPLLSWKGVCDTYEEWQGLCDDAREYVAGPEPPRWKQAYYNRHETLLEDLTPEQWNIPKYVRKAINAKHRRRTWFKHPEPGTSFSYEQWKQGKFTGRAIHPQSVGMWPDPLHHDHIPVRLEEKFHRDGLQVVVEITRIELTPENPVYPRDTHFHTEGLRNDHIVATSLYVVESKNVTQARIAFEHEDKVHAGELECEVADALSKVLDVDCWEPREEEPPRALHTFGSVGTMEGHLLSWPNTYRSKQESFRLKDACQPGNLTLVKLRLVDPHYRVCSTRNVPPQQHAWWAAAAEQASGLDKRLPRELVLSVMEQADWWPMSEAEARQLREELHSDHERVREVINGCMGHHVTCFLPYDEINASESTGGIRESP
jgi:hypothetical protein